MASLPGSAWPTISREIYSLRRAKGSPRAMRNSAYRSAGWQPRDVDLIECHATGTPVGDLVEFQSLMSLWGDSPSRPGACVVGSVKSTVGHLLTGANAAGLMKILLALRHARLPGMANFRESAPGIHSTARRSVSSHAVPWICAATKTFPGGRRSVVSVSAALMAVFADRRGLGSDVAAKRPIPSRPPAIAIVRAAARFRECEGLEAFAGRTLGLDGAKFVSTAGHAIQSIDVPLGVFPIPPKEMEEMLPQQLLMLLTAEEVLRGGAAIGGERTGVFIGLDLDRNTTNFHMRWWAGEHLGEAVLNAASPPLTANRTMVALASIAASRIARAFRIGGPSFTISSGETSGLHALEVAASLLQRGEIDCALVGAVDLACDPRAGQADGAVALFLRRFADAERDGDQDPGVDRRGRRGAALHRMPGPSHPDAEREENTVESRPWSVSPTEAMIGRCVRRPALQPFCVPVGARRQILPPRIDFGNGAEAKAQFWLHDFVTGPCAALIEVPGLIGNTSRLVLQECPARERSVATGIRPRLTR